jgi:hypothetical protein
MIRCDAPGCVRGVVHRLGGWGDACKLCGGLGGFTVAGLARALDENEKTLVRLIKGKRMRVSTLARICGKVVDFAGL